MMQIKPSFYSLLGNFKVKKHFKKYDSISKQPFSSFGTKELTPK